METLQEISLGVVVNEGHILLIERANQEQLADGSQLSWAFPGGKLKDGESSASACIREVLEETGAHVRTTTLLDERRHQFAPVMHRIGCVMCWRVEDNQSLPILQSVTTHGCRSI